MKVAVFAGDYSQSVGGGYTFQQEICRAIESHGPASGHEFVFFCPKGFAGTSVQAGFKVVYYEDNGRKTRVSKLCKNAFTFFAGVVSRRIPSRCLERLMDPISALLREEAIDMVWSLNPSSYSSEVPFITTLWDLEHRNQPFFPEVSIQNEWEAREAVYCSLLKKAAYVITGTKAGMAEIMNFYHLPGDRIRVVPFPAPRFSEQRSLAEEERVLQAYGLPEHYLFYPAQFWPHKNHYGLLMSLLALRDTYGLTLPVVFVGSDKGNLPYIQKTVKELGLEDQVHFLGFVPRDHLPLLYRHAGALIFLSLFGPDNLPPLEAFGLGCPVVASNVSGAEEQLGDAALLVDPKDPADVAAAIHRLFTDPALRQTLVSRGLARSSVLTGENYLKEVCSIFDGFLKVRRTWSSSEPFKLVR